jgi:F-type H+-transporting ATPase subunit b
MTTTVLAESNFLVPNGTLLAEFVAFLIVLGALWKWVVPRVQKAMEDRQAFIQAQLEESQAAKERLEAAEEDYKRILADARHEAARLREEAQARHKAIVDEAADAARARSDEILAGAQERIAFEHRQAVAQLRAELGGLALELASRIVGETLQDSDQQRRAVDRFLDELESRAPAEQSSGATREQV